MDPWNSASGGFAYIWQSKWVRIIAIKNEGTEIHFLSDALVVVASLDLKVPIIRNEALRTSGYEANNNKNSNNNNNRIFIQDNP